MSESPIELMLRDRGYLKSSKLTGKRHKDSIHSSNILNLFPPSSRMRMTSTSTVTYLDVAAESYQSDILRGEELNVLGVCRQGSRRKVGQGSSNLFCSK